MSNSSSDLDRLNFKPALDSAQLRHMVTQKLPHSAVFLVDCGLRYILAEGAELDMVGLSSSHFIGKTVRDMVPRDQVMQAEQDYHQALNGGTFSREHVVNHRHYLSYGMPLLAGDGACDARFALVVSFDVTERVRAERQRRLLSEVGMLAQRSTDQASLLDEISVLIRNHADVADFLLVDVLSETAQLSDVSTFLQRHKLPCQVPMELLGDECVAWLRLGRTIIQPDIQQGGPTCDLFDTLGLRSYVIVPHMYNECLTGVFAACRLTARGFQPYEITAMKIVAASVWSTLTRSRTLQSLLNAERHKKQIFALLGHELRNPVSTLTGGISLLKQTVGDERALKTLDVMERQANQMTRLIEDLLGASYVNFGKLELQLEDVSFRDIVENVIQAMQASAMRKRQQLTHCAASGSVMIRADHSKLMQVVTNLISNAIKYTPDGGHIEAEVVDNGDAALLILRDNGAGIAPQVLPHLFELFVRGTEGPHPTASGQTGLGIGLWVVKQFVDAHGGRVSVTSAGPGQGSVFEVRLPKSGTINPT